MDSILNLGLDTLTYGMAYAILALGVFISYRVLNFADMTTEGEEVTVIGPSDLKGAEVVATDLRAGAALVAAGLKAEGVTRIQNIEHILRGYENIVEKLQSVGAKIESLEI